MAGILIFITGALLTAYPALVLLIKRPRLHTGIALPMMMGVPLMLCGLFPPEGLIRYAVIAAYAAVCAFFAATTAMLLKAARRRAPYNADVLIVLGCAVYGSTPSRTLTLRLDAALRYLEHSPDTTLILAGGLMPWADVSEAAAMRDCLVGRGVSPSRMILEDKSASTWENFKFAKPMIERRFPNASIAFITTGFHVYRSERVARMHGLTALPFAARDAWYIAPLNYIREGVAVVWYRLRGLLI